METFSALLTLCEGNSPVTGEFPSQRPVTWSFDVFFDMRLNKRLSKQSWGWWFETPSHPLWRHCNEAPVRRKAFPCNDIIVHSSLFNSAQNIFIPPCLNHTPFTYFLSMIWCTSNTVSILHPPLIMSTPRKPRLVNYIRVHTKTQSKRTEAKVRETHVSYPIEAEIKWLTFAGDILKFIFLGEKCEIGFAFHWSSLFIRAQWRISHHFSDAGLVPDGRQAIIWTNDGLGYWHMCASLGLSSLMGSMINETMIVFLLESRGLVFGKEMETTATSLLVHGHLLKPLTHCVLVQFVTVCYIDVTRQSSSLRAKPIHGKTRPILKTATLRIVFFL